MRGVVALAAANSLPLTLSDGQPFPRRSLIIFLTFSLGMVTLVFQGISLLWLVRILRLTTADRTVCEENEARDLLLQAAMGYLAKRKDTASAERELHGYMHLLDQFEHKAEEIDSCGPDGSLPSQSSAKLTQEGLLVDAIRRQREELDLLRATGRMGDGVHRNLDHELDSGESRVA